MNLHYQLLSKAETVISIAHVSDDEPTVQGFHKILNLICQSEPQFAGQVAGSPKMSFSFGDKYFYPISNLSLLCIPCHVEDLRFWLSKNVKGDWKSIEADFEKMKPKLSESGYFDVSGY